MRERPTARWCLVTLCFVFLCLSGGPIRSHRTVTDALDRTVTVPETPDRIFSGGLNLTSTVAKLESLDRLVAVSQFASDTRFSFIAGRARKHPVYPQVRAEIVLRYRPDLVLLTPFTPSKTRTRIMNLNIPVLVTHEVFDLEDIVNNTRIVGSALGKRERMKQVVKSLRQFFNNRINPGSVRSGPTVLYYPYSGVIPGKQTLPDLIMQAAGVKNGARGIGISGWKNASTEALLQLNPEWIVVDRTNGEATLRKLREGPVLSGLRAVQRDRIRSFWPKYLTVASPYLKQAVQYWENRFTEGRSNGR